MNKLWRASLLLAVAFLVSAANSVQAAQPVYGTEFTVEPAGSGVYKVQAKVTDLTAKTVVLGATLKVAADEPASTETVLPDGRTKVLMTVKLDSVRHTASYSIVIRRAEEILASSSASVPLP
jgi:LEA14-like dessication related protein